MDCTNDGGSYKGTSFKLESSEPGSLRGGGFRWLGPFHKEYKGAFCIVCVCVCTSLKYRETIHIYVGRGKIFFGSNVFWFLFYDYFC